MRDHTYNPSITVIMSSIGIHQDTIATAVNSFLDQDYDNAQLLIMNYHNESLRIKNVPKGTNKKIILCNEEDKWIRPVYQYTYELKKVNTDCWTVLDDDDWIEPNHLSQLVEYWNKCDDRSDSPLRVSTRGVIGEYASTSKKMRFSGWLTSLFERLTPKEAEYIYKNFPPDKINGSDTYITGNSYYDKRDFNGEFTYHWDRTGNNHVSKHETNKDKTTNDKYERVKNYWRIKMEAHAMNLEPVDLSYGYINKGEYLQKVDSLDDKYWSKTASTRWDYIEPTIQYLKNNRMTNIIEAGCGGISINKNSDTISLDSSGDYQFDLTDTPWPIEDNAYDAFVAFQVWEHLGDGKTAAFQEACRVAETVILSLPYKWKTYTETHQDIDDNTVYGWFGLKADSTIVSDICNNHKRKIYIWNNCGYNPIIDDTTKEADCTVITPAYESGWCISRMLESVADQEILPKKILIGIDACEDTRDAFPGCIPSSIGDRVEVYYFDEHQGPYMIRNTLVDKCCTGTITFFDADDEMEPQHIKKQLKLLNPNVMVYGKGRCVKEGEVTKHDFVGEGVFTIYTKDFLELNGFEPKLCAMDTEFKWRSLNAGLHHKEAREETYIRHKHGNNLTDKPETALGSDIRFKMHDLIKKRWDENYQKDTFETVECDKII